MMLDANIEHPVEESYTIDGLLKAWHSKNDFLDGIAEKTVPKVYNVDGLLEKARRGYYQLASVLVAA